MLLLIFTKTMLLLSLNLIFFFFMKITLTFSCSGMFRDVPACSGMFRNVPCSGFYRRCGNVEAKNRESNRTVIIVIDREFD